MTDATYWEQFDAHSFGPEVREKQIVRYLNQFQAKPEDVISLMCGPTSFIHSNLGSRYIQPSTGNEYNGVYPYTKNIF